MKKNERKGGFEDIPEQERCRNAQHDPPTHMVIPPGKQYRHICPGCGLEILLRPPMIWMTHQQITAVMRSLSRSLEKTPWKERDLHSELWDKFAQWHAETTPPKDLRALGRALDRSIGR